MFLAVLIVIIGQKTSTIVLGDSASGTDMDAFAGPEI
jgi:hypothetical protein